MTLEKNDDEKWRDISEDEWADRLTPERYHVLREGGTEPPFEGEYVDCHEDGIYRCAACYSPLFSSKDKFDSGTGWPSFTKPLISDAILQRPDETGRVEVLCSTCGSHLGHVFPDGPPPTNMRYCMNSIALELE